MPPFVTFLTDIHKPSAGGKQPGQLGLLITISRTDVEVQAKLSVLGTRSEIEHDRRLQPAESRLRRADLDTVPYSFELNEPEHLTPEGGQPSRIKAVDDQLAYPACHTATVPTRNAAPAVDSTRRSRS